MPIAAECHSFIGIGRNSELDMERDSMNCECGARYRRVLPARNSFNVLLSRDPTSTPVSWTDQKLVICLMCGNFVGQTPDDVLEVLRKGAGENEVAE